MKALDFQSEPNADALMAAITYFKVKDGNISKNAPLDFLEDEQRTTVNNQGIFRISLYKVFLFMHIAYALKSGTLNLEHSHKYRPLDDYMISKQRWNRDRNQLIERAELQDFVDPVPLLDMLDNSLHQQY